MAKTEKGHENTINDSPRLQS